MQQQFTDAISTLQEVQNMRDWTYRDFKWSGSKRQNADITAQLCLSAQKEAPVKTEQVEAQPVFREEPAEVELPMEEASSLENAAATLGFEVGRKTQNPD